jgi:hypothetical protein
MSAEALVDDMVLAEEAPADFGSERTPSRRTKRCLQDESVWRTFDDARDVVKREVAVTRPPTERERARRFALGKSARGWRPGSRN